MVTRSNDKLKTMVELAILSALVVVLQLLSSVMKIGPVTITLSLIPLVIGAAKHGWISGVYLGGLLGLVNFITSFFNPVLLILFESSPVLYILVCFGKTMLAGAAAGGLYRLFGEKHSFLGTCLAALAAPLVNTGVFFIFMALFFRGAIVAACGGAVGGNVVTFIITGFIGVNFLVEFGLNAVLTPAFDRILRAIMPRRKFVVGEIMESSAEEEGVAVLGAPEGEIFALLEASFEETDVVDTVAETDECETK